MVCYFKIIVLVTISVLWPAEILAATDQPPERDDDNVIVAFYNIQWVGEKPHDFGLLAKVIKHFDICKVLEIKNEKAMRHLAEALEAETGKDWGYVFGTRTRRPGGRYHEAFGALWRKDRVELGDGLVGGIWDMGEKYRNDPYMTAFKAGDLDFLLFSLHTRWSDDLEGTRKGEVAAIAEQMAYIRGFLEEDDIFVGGDFNYSGRSTPMKAMARNSDLVQLDDNPKTTFKRDGSDYGSAYDHIYATESAASIVLGEPRAQALDVTNLIYGAKTPALMKRAKSELSDHLPVFMILDRQPPAVTE